MLAYDFHPAPTLSPLVCKSFLPPLPESILLWKGENESFPRENEKVKEGKPRAEARAWSVSQPLLLEPQRYWALWKIQRDDVGPAFKKLEVWLGERTSRPETLN